jgi:hypothetical protein
VVYAMMEDAQAGLNPVVAQLLPQWGVARTSHYDALALLVDYLQPRRLW